MANVINPNVKEEVVVGLKLTLFFILGTILEIAGIVVIAVSLGSVGGKILGDLIGLGGLALIIYVITKNFKAKHGKGFKMANIIMKIFVAFLLTLLLIMTNFS